MSKNSTEPKEDRRSTDGKISTEDLSAAFGVGVSSSPVESGATPEDLEFVTIHLTDVNMEVFETLREGMPVVLRPGKRIKVLTEKGVLIGRIRTEDVKKVSALLSQNPNAWISNLYHKGVAVRIEKNGRVS